MNLPEFNKVCVGSGDCKNKTVRKSLSKNSNRAMAYLTPNARWVFTQLNKTFTKALIFQQFDLESHIRIETDVTD